MISVGNLRVAIIVIVVYICIGYNVEGINLRVVGLLDMNVQNEINLDSYVTEINTLLQKEMMEVPEVNMTIILETLPVNSSSDTVDDVLTKIGNTSNVLALLSGLQEDSPLADQLLVDQSMEGIPLLDTYPDTDRIVRYPSLVAMNAPVNDVTSTLVRLLTHLHWSYVQAVYLNTSYFSDILAHVQTVAGRANICVLKAFPIHHNSTTTQILNTIQSLEREYNTTGVVLLMDSTLTNRFIEVVKTLKSLTLFHFITLGNLEDLNVSPILGTLTISREWNHTRVTDPERNGTSAIPFIESGLRLLLYGLDLAMPDVTNCVVRNTTGMPNVCIRQSLLRTLRGEMDNISVYNYQALNHTKAWVKTMPLEEKENHIISPIVFYNKDDEPLDGDVFSTSQPWRWECRLYITENVYASQRADVYLLAVLPVHEAAHTPNGCGDLDPDQVVLAEAISYGVDTINNDTAILPGLSLGYIMIDSCSLADRTIFQLEKMYSFDARNGNDFHVASQIFGAVGFTRYNEYSSLAGYLHSKSLLTISATASDSEFSNKEIYPDFMRMVPDQQEEIRVMFQLLKLFGVKYIGILHSDVHPNDVSALKAVEEANTFDISVVYIAKAAKDVSQIDADMDYLVETFIERNLNSTTVLMTFAEARELFPLFRAMQRRNVEQVVWIGGTSWFASLHSEDLLPYSDVIRRAFVVGIATYPVQSFNRHLTQIQSNNITKSAYMDELLNLMSTCQNKTDDDQTDTICNKLHADMFSHNDAYLIIDSIKALASGLDEIIHNKCPLGDFCSGGKSHLAGRLRDNIFKYHFPGSSGKKIRFDSKGNGPASFEIHRLVFDAQTTIISYQKVGSFEDGSLSIFSDLSISSLGIRKSDCSFNSCAHVPADIVGKPFVYIDGDPMLYGFVKIFQSENDDTCSGHVDKNGYQVMESMVWGVTVINNSTTLLPNMKLGLAVFPTCGVATKTTNIVQSVLLPNLVLPTKGLRPNTTILGIVGGETVGEAISVETATRAVDAEIPVIISSRADVSDGIPHPRLFRTVLSPFAEMDYILELCLQLQWTAIHIVHGPLMENVVSYLEDISKANGICIGSRNMLERSSSSEVTKSTLANMTEVEGATAVILVTSPSISQQVLRVAREMQLLGKLFFVLPFEVYDLENYLSEQDIGLLSTRKNVQINDQFMNYFLSLDISDKANDPWFADFWQQANSCNLRLSNTYAKDCSNSERLSSINVTPSPSINAILDSVFSLGHALNDLLRECKEGMNECIKGDRAIFYNNLARYLSAVNFTTPGGTPFKFRDKTTASQVMIVTNVQKSPDGGIRLVDVGNFQNGKLTLDRRKLSFYRNGLRVTPTSRCLGDCRICLDPDFVNAYDARVSSLQSAGPILEHKFFTALGVIDILLIVMSFMFIIMAAYFLCKFYKHKVFNLCADADTGILIGCSIMTLSSCCHLFTQTKLMCTIQIAAPALSYIISIVSLIVKINKTVCLRSYLGLQQSSVPRWDFTLTYIPLLLVPTIIAFFKWMQSDVININSTVPGIREISNIDEVTITWSCSFDKEIYSVYMTTFWFVIVEVFIIALSYKLRSKKEPEVNQVMWSSTISLVLIAVCTLVLMLSGDVEVYDIVMCFVLNVNAMVFVCANFLPAVLVLMTEEQREEQFMNLMTQDRVARMAKFWKEGKSKERPEKETSDVNRRDGSKTGASALWNKGKQLSLKHSTTSFAEA